MVVTDKTNLRAGQNHAHFEFIGELIVVVRAAIYDGGRFLVGLLHIAILSLGELFFNLSLKGAVKVALEAGIGFLAERTVGEQACLVFNLFGAGVPGRGVVVECDGVFGLVYLAGKVVFWTEILGRKDRKIVVAIDTRFSVKL